MKRPKRPTDRFLAIRSGIVLVLLYSLQGLVIADPSLPLPSWDTPKLNESFSLGVIPAKQMAVEFVTAAPPTVDEVEPEDLKGVLNHGQSRLHVNKAFQLYLPPPKKQPDAPSAMVTRTDATLERLSLESLVAAIQRTVVGDPLVYLGKARPEAQLTTLRRFTQYMSEQVGKDISVLLLDEDQVFEMEIYWDEVFKLYSKHGSPKSVLLVIGQRDELLKVILPSERRSGLDESGWLGLIQKTETALASFHGHREDVPLRVLMNLTTALHQVEGWEAPEKRVQAHEAQNEVDAPELQELAAESSSEAGGEMLKGTGSSSPDNELAFKKEAQPFPWLGSGLAIGMGFVALLAWKKTNRLSSAVLDASSVEPHSEKVIPCGLSGEKSNHPFAFVASYKKEPSSIYAPADPLMNKNMD